MSTGKPIAFGSRPEDGGLAVPLFFWSAVQIAVLAIAAGDLPLVVAQGQPTERWALPFLLAAQFGAGALFAEPLLAGPSRAAINIAIVWPMLQLAGLLAGEPQSHILAASGALTLWLTGLACWTMNLPPGIRPVISAVASAWALGGAGLAYCHADFGSSPGESIFPMDAWLSPLLGAMQVSTNPGHWGTWGVLAVHCGIAMAVAAIITVYRHRPGTDAAGRLTSPRP
jgi:hypothetical protein